MKLYHGTSTCYLDTVLSDGIKPRDEQLDGKQGNWQTYPSRGDLTYLTVAYPFYFAICAAGETSDRDDQKFHPVVFEIESDDLDQDLFFPDEDFIAQAMAQQEKMTLEDCHDYVRDNLENWRDLWTDSIEHMGNCAYQGLIPASAIKRHCIFEQGERPYLSMAFLDPAISILNYRFMGAKHRAFVEWMFQDAELLPGATDPWGVCIGEGKVETPPEMAEQFKKQMEYWTAESQNRDGIELVSKL